MVLAMTTEHSGEEKAARLRVGVIAGSTRPGRQSRTVARGLSKRPIRRRIQGLAPGTGSLFPDGAGPLSLDHWSRPSLWLPWTGLECLFGCRHAA
jgi:hypothetical protein